MKAIDWQDVECGDIFGEMTGKKKLSGWRRLKCAAHPTNTGAAVCIVPTTRRTEALRNAIAGGVDWDRAGSPLGKVTLEHRPGDAVRHTMTADHEVYNAALVRVVATLGRPDRWEVAVVTDKAPWPAAIVAYRNSEIVGIVCPMRYMDKRKGFHALIADAGSPDFERFRRRVWVSR